MCGQCQLKYPVRDGVPVMVADEAIDMRKESRKVSTTASGKVPTATFRVVDGANRGLVFHLEMGTCKAIGRAVSDPNKTAMFNVDLNLALDESTKALILKYITKQFRKSAKDSATDSGKTLGAFRRTADIILDDASVSKLHAMIFFDEAGVGILDLVSKNGTFINGEEVESRLLRRGDNIEIGETTIVFNQ